MAINNMEITSNGILAAFLLDPQDMICFEFYELTDILVSMWADSRLIMRKSFIDFIIITAINQRDAKGITRQQYVELVYLLVPPKVKKASKEALENHENISGLFSYL